MSRIILSIVSLIFFNGIMFGQSGHLAFKQDFNSGTPDWYLQNDSNIVGNFQYEDAWIRIPRENAGDSCAASTSFFIKKATASRWMIFGPISIEENAILSWEAQAANYTYPDGYEVFVSKTSNFNNGSHSVSSMREENDFWTPRRVNLSAFGYEKEDIYIAFKQNSYNKDVLLIDNIEIRDTSSILQDFELLSDSTTLGFDVQVPYRQGAAAPFSVVARNSGKQTSNGNIDIEVYDENLQKIKTKKISVPELQPGETYRTPEIFFPDLTSIGKYKYRIHVENDDLNFNNLQEIDLSVGSRFSSARPEKVTPFEIDYSTKGMVGTSYTYVKPDTIVAIEYWIDNESGKFTGTNIYGGAYKKDDKGGFNINEPISLSDTIQIQDGFEGNIRLNFPQPIIVLSDTQEKSTELLFAVGRDSYEPLTFTRDKGVDIYNGIRNYIYAGSQTNSNFVPAQQLKVKGNFGVTSISKDIECILDVTYEIVKEPTVFKFTGNPRPDSIQQGEILIKSINNGTPPYTAKYEKSIDRQTMTFSVPSSISYGEPYTDIGHLHISIWIMDANNCYFSLILSEICSTELIENTSGVVGINPIQVTVWPNPAEKTLHFSKNLMRSSVLVFDVNGQKVYEETIGESNQLNIESLPSGIYIGQILNNEMNGYFRFIKH